MEQSQNERSNNFDSSNEEGTRDKKSNNALRNARKARGLTQAQLAEMIGVDEKTVRRWETGVSKPQPVFIEALCGFFNATQDQLNLALSENVHQVNESDPQEKVIISSSSQPSKGFVFRPWMAWAGGLLVFAVLIVCLGPVILQTNWKPSQPKSHVTQYVPNGSPVLLHQGEPGCSIDSNEAGYLKVYTKKEILCFSGGGTLPLSIENVRRVELGKYPAHWTYQKIDNTYHLTPSSQKPNLYWCTGVVRDYHTSVIHMVNISIVPDEGVVECAHYAS